MAQMLRDIMRKDTSRGLRKSELDERLQYERQHARPGEVVDVLHESDGPEMAHCLAVLSDDWTPAPQIPDESDPVSSLIEWGLSMCQANQIAIHVASVADLRVALAAGRVRRWGQCDVGTERAVVRALAKVGSAAGAECQHGRDLR